MSRGAPATEGVPADVRSFLASLARAVQRYGLYPPGHPALADLTDGLHGELAPLLAEHGVIELAVAPDRLLFQGSWTDPDSPGVSGLAGRLHEHDLSALGLEPQVGPSELGALLTALREKPASDADRLGRRAGMAARWPRVWLEPRHYERLALRDAAPDEAPESRDRRAARLWLGLARAAGAAPAEAGTGAGAGPADGEAPEGWETPDLVAAAVAVEPEAVAGAVAALRDPEALRRTGAALAAASDDLDVPPATFDLRERISRLVGTLGREDIRRLLSVGMDSGQRRTFLARTSSSLPADTLVDAVGVSSDLGEVEVSHWLLRILVKLARHAGVEDGVTSPEAEQALRSQVRRAMLGWSQDAEAFDDAYGDALRTMSELGDLGGLPHGPEDGGADPLRILQTSAEVDTLGAPGEAAFRALREAGRLGDLLDVAGGAPEEGTVGETLWRRLATEEVVRELAGRSPPHLDGLAQLAGRIPSTVAGPLLDILVESQDRAIRGRAYGMLVDLGEDAAGLVVSRLQDDRWYVKRNMLALLYEMGAPAGFSARPYAAHEHVQVRREAYKHLVADESTLEEGARMALRESDPRTLMLGLAAVERMPEPDPGLSGLLASHARDEDLPEETRVQAVRGLAHVGGSTARHTMLRLSRRRHPILFWRHRLAPPTRVAREAVAALARGWSRDPSVQRLLVKAADSEHAELRAAARAGAAEDPGDGPDRAEGRP
ncbi:MAG TPA: hypothetical protein VKA44_04890 [Gemmatimonadota bacterium]|nr:hypothetical protein [Gemmatimonadota bacterium]